MKPTVIL